MVTVHARKPLRREFGELYDCSGNGRTKVAHRPLDDRRGDAAAQMLPEFGETCRRSSSDYLGKALKIACLTPKSSVFAASSSPRLKVPIT